MHPSRVTSMASVAGMVSGPKGMHAAAESKKKDEAGAIVAVPRVIRRDPDAIHRTGSLRDLFEMCRLPGKKRELKEFLKVSPHLCRRTITYGKGHSYGIGWYPCHYPGCVSVALRWSIHRGVIAQNWVDLDRSLYCFVKRVVYGAGRGCSYRDPCGCLRQSNAAIEATFLSPHALCD